MFGILSTRWRFLRPPVQAQPEKAVNSILAAVALHNWLKKHKDSEKCYGCLYCPPGYVDYEDSHGLLRKGVWRSELFESRPLQKSAKWEQIITQNQLTIIDRYLQTFLFLDRVSYLGSKIMLAEHPIGQFAKKHFISYLLA